jgi:hypothetical protein
MREYLDKLVLPQDKKIEKTLTGKIVLGWMKFYNTVTLRDMNSELSNFDYFVFFSMIEGAYVLKRKDLGYLFDEAIPTVLSQTKGMADSKKAKKAQMIFDISRTVNKKGIIKYLMLGEPKVVETLYKKYKNDKQGIGLLIKLLEKRYSGKYP